MGRFSDVAYLHAAQSRLYTYATSELYDGINRTEARPHTVIGTTIVTREMHNKRPTSVPTNCRMTTQQKCPIESKNRNDKGFFSSSSKRLGIESDHGVVVRRPLSLQRGKHHNDCPGGFQVLGGGAPRGSKRSLGRQNGKWGVFLVAAPSDEQAHCALTPISGTLSYAMVGPRARCFKVTELCHYAARPLSAAATGRGVHHFTKHRACVDSGIATTNVFISTTESEPPSGKLAKVNYRGVAHNDPDSFPHDSSTPTAISVPQGRRTAMYHSVTSKNEDDIKPTFDRNTAKADASWNVDDASLLGLSDGELSYISNNNSVASPWRQQDRPNSPVPALAFAGKQTA